MNDVFTPEDRERSRTYGHRATLQFVVGRGLRFAVLSALAYGLPRTPLREALPGEDSLLPLLVGFAAALIAEAAAYPVARARHRLNAAFGLDPRADDRWVVDWNRSALAGAIQFAYFGWVMMLSAQTLWPIALIGIGALLIGAFTPGVVSSRRIRPLDDPDLEGQLHDLAHEAGIPVGRIQVFSASAHTSMEGAYIRGEGVARRVVLFDTLLRSPRDDRLIRQAFAHELGHAKAHDIWKRATVQALTWMGIASLVAWVLRSDALLTAGHLRGPLDALAAPLVILMITAFNLILTPLVTGLARGHERRADRFALSLTKDPEGFIETQRRLALANLAELDPGRLAYLWFSTHGTPDERIDLAR